MKKEAQRMVDRDDNIIYFSGGVLDETEKAQIP